MLEPYQAEKQGIVAPLDSDSHLLAKGKEHASSKNGNTGRVAFLSSSGQSVDFARFAVENALGIYANDFDLFVISLEELGLGQPDSAFDVLIIPDVSNAVNLISSASFPNASLVIGDAIRVNGMVLFHFRKFWRGGVKTGF